MKEKKEINAHCILKFLKGSKHVTKKDKKYILTALFCSCFTLASIFAAKKGARKYFKNSILFIMALVAAFLASGSGILMGTHFYHRK